MDAVKTTQGLTFTERFSTYFSRDVAHRAAKSIADGAEIEFSVCLSADPKVQTPAIEAFTFTRVEGRNLIRAAPSSSAQILFKMTPQAAEAILNDPTEEIGQIGVNIAKLMISPDANRRIGMKLQVGFMSLFSKGYLGVLTTGGSEFGSFLASRGQNGLRAVQSLLRKKSDL